MFKQILRSLVLLLTLSFGASAFPDTVTLRDGINDYIGTEDVDPLFAFPDTTRGAISVLNTSHNTSMILIRFKIFASEGGPVPNGATITSATLSLLKYEGPTSIYEARRVKKAWKEMEATWNVAASGLSWQTAGSQGANDVEATADGQATAPLTGWFNLDVTAGVQAFAGGAPNNGWRVGYVSGTTGAKSFYSRNRTPEADRRPGLTITYTHGCTPPTASLNATPTTGNAPLNVIFDASGSSAPSADPITSLTLQYGDGSPNTVWADKNQTQPHTYATANNYVASLTATNSCGTSAPATRPITATTDGGGGDIPPATPAAGTAGTAIPTFHSMSLYYTTAKPANCTTSNGSGCKVWMRYRKASEPNSAWREGYPLWFDPRTTSSSRGSAVHLEAGTKYYFEFGTGTSFAGAAWQHHVAGTTWAENFPEGTVTTIPSQSTPFVITQSGTASAYRVYDGWNGSAKNVVDRGGQGTGSAQGTDASHAIVVRASHVIVRRVVARGAATAAIYIAPNVTDVVIEEVVAEDWAWRMGVCCTNDPEPNPNSWGTWGWNQAGGIHLGGNNSRVVMQRNVIRAPHFGAFPWDTSMSCTSPTNHPIGPNGITVQTGGQQNVIRYNEITGHPTDKNKWYMDGIGGEENFSTAGSPGADSDIYQNIIMHVFDDAIEAEGGGRNVRVWGNYTSDTRVAIATTTVHFGPTYVWRNLMNRMRVCHQSITNTDDDWFGQAFKYGGFNGGHGDGARYLFHNTLLQQPLGTHGEGAGRGIEPTSNGAGSVRWTTAQNNIFHVRSDTHSQAWSVEIGDSPVGSVFTNNLFNGRYDTHVGSPDLDFEFSGSQVFYKPGHGWQSVPALGGGGQGNYQLETGSKGQDTWAAGKACVPLPNFNDGFSGAAPDCGAHEAGAPAMKFGITATP